MNVQLEGLAIVFDVVLLARLVRLARRGRVRREHSLFSLVGLAGGTGLLVLDQGAAHPEAALWGRPRRVTP